MSVTGTPISVPDLPEPTAGAKTPSVTELFGVPIPARQRSLAVRRGACVAASVQFGDDDGDPLDLVSYLDSSRYTPTIAVREALRPSREDPTFLVATLTTSGGAYYAEAILPRQVCNLPGIYLVESALTDDQAYPRASVEGEIVQTITRSSGSLVITTNASTYTYADYVEPLVVTGQALTLKQQLVRNVCLVLSSQVYLLVERGLFGSSVNQALGPPTRAEIRLHLRDFPEANLLLDDYEFDDADLAQAMALCLDSYNTMLPRSGSYQDTTTFPYRALWLDGTLGRLFQVAASWHRRNKLSYSAGGVSVADTDKEPEYLRAAQFHQQRFEEQARLIKVRDNMQSFYGSVGSSYSGWYNSF